MKKCDVLELMELQMERREREEHRLKLDLDSIQDEMNALRISRLQIQAEVFPLHFYDSLGGGGSSGFLRVLHESIELIGHVTCFRIHE